MTDTAHQLSPLAPRLATALLEINVTEPSQAPRLVLRVVCALFAILVVWACVAKLDIVAVADRRSAQAQLALKRLELKRVEAQLAGRALVRAPSDEAGLFSQVQADASARMRTQADAVQQEEATARRMESELLSARETLARGSLRR
ncbi:MAG TPA: hypothetical protein PLK05_14015 [Steroidobacteraceae bacterium]|nr:hypothetical protein [Steroidobacteraceae bacterium]HQW10286.1 hypothetical protein [Steroidobacteraceae bacterium]